MICGFPPKRIPQENGTSLLLPVLVSRYVLGRMFPTRTTEDLLLGNWLLLQQSSAGFHGG